MTLEVKAEIAAALQALASAKGLSVEEYLEYVVQKETPVIGKNESEADVSGMVWEDGLFVYRTGNPLPRHVVDETIHQVREERTQQILGKRP